MNRPSPRQLEALAAVASGNFYPDFVKEEDGWHARWRAVGLDNPWVDEYVRGPSVTPLSEDAEDQRHETLHDAWALALRSRTGLVRWDEAECEVFAAELAAWNGGAHEDVAARRGLVFSFCPSGTDADGGAFAIRCTRPRGRAQYRALGGAVCVWGALRNLRADGAELRVALTRGEAEDFLRRGARDLSAAGYGVAGADLSAAVTSAAEVDDGAEGDASSASVRLVIKVDGEEATAEEIRFLLEQGTALVFFRDRWIEVDRAELREALKALERAGRTKANPLTFALGIGAVGRLEIDDVMVRGGLRGLVSRLRRSGGADGAAELPAVNADGLAATLRGYQMKGVAWIRFLTDNGFGALLADDMGLGKTIQTIAWILSLARERAPGAARRPFLVVAPLTLLSNWRHEFAKFAPGLSVYVHQGELRHVASGFRLAVAEADVVMTSYTLLVREQRLFAEVEWDGAVLDEAQAVKNPDTQAARAIRALGAPRRLALTGTPIENSVADIWSIEEFLNPGLLGERKAFTDRFVKPLALDPRSAQGAKLRRALEPFVLRRLKGDPGVAGEIGEKREIREYCALSAVQRADYERALADYRGGERRQGDVFALLTELKLVCDGLRGERIAGGKVERLAELLEAIFAGGESALVFTQYAKVGRALQRELETRFGRRFPFLHGALGAKAREAEIARFESGGAGAFILSLKAGGFGLNLTKATHVIHYDRWWNPAVEAQATDRAHRIGQDRTVFVHAFVTEGTLEERVEEILERKGSLTGILKDAQAFWDVVKVGEKS